MSVGGPNASCCCAYVPVQQAVPANGGGTVASQPVYTQPAPGGPVTPAPIAQPVAGQQQIAPTGQPVAGQPAPTGQPGSYVDPYTGLVTTVDPTTGVVTTQDPASAPPIGSQPTAPQTGGPTGTTPTGPGGTAGTPTSTGGVGGVSTDPNAGNVPTTPGSTDANGGPTANDPEAVVPANQLPSWAQWEAEFAKLGLSEQEIATIGGEFLTDRQLAEVYIAIEQSVGEKTDPNAPTDPTDPNKPQTGESAWTPEWTQKFQALGLSAEEVAKIEEAAKAKGATDAEIQATYDGLKSQLPGWNEEWQKKFEALGMPKEMIEAYAQGGAPESGLQAIYDDAKKRWEAFSKRERPGTLLFGTMGGGDKWVDELKGQGVKKDELWAMALSAKPISDQMLEGQLNAKKKESTSMPMRVTQNIASFLPGVDLAQYVVGRKFITGESIDSTDWGNLGWAALSGLSAFAAIRGGMNISRGLSAIKSGSALAGSEALKQGTLGALFSGGFSKVKAFVPFTKEMRTAVAAKHFDSMVNVFENGGKQAMLDKGLTKEVDDVVSLIDDVRNGDTLLRSASKLGYMGKFNHFPVGKIVEPPLALKAGKNGKMYLETGKALPASRGAEALLAHAAGVKTLAQATKTGSAALEAEASQMVGKAALALREGGERGVTLPERGPVGRVLGKIFPGVQESAEKAIVGSDSYLANLDGVPAATTGLDDAAGVVDEGIEAAAGATGESVVNSGIADTSGVSRIARAVAGQTESGLIIAPGRAPGDYRYAMGRDIPDYARFSRPDAPEWAGSDVDQILARFAARRA